MAEGRTWHVSVYVPDDPLDANDGVVVDINGPQGHRSRIFLDPARTRAQLVTDALTALRAYILAQSPPP